MVKLVGTILTVLSLVAYFGQAAVRLNAIEERAAKVPDMDKKIQVLFLYVKLVDPENFQRAENLSK